MQLCKAALYIYALLYNTCPEICAVAGLEQGTGRGPRALRAQRTLLRGCTSTFLLR